MDYLQDKDFLKQLDLDRNKKTYVRIIVLDKTERPISTIEGRVTGGSVSVDGSSSVQRTCTLSFIPEDKDMSFTNINNLLSINKRIRIDKGVENNINTNYDKIVWFKQGIFIINQVNISHSTSGLSVSLSCKDKMCLLNGDCGGTLPASVTFHEYDQIIGYEECDDKPVDPNERTVYKIDNKFYEWKAKYGWEELENDSAVGTIETIKQRVYDIILTAVCNYGHEDISNIFISDVPIELKQLVRYVGDDTLYFNVETSKYLLSPNGAGTWKEFKYNEDVGYVFTDFVYPGELITNIGATVTSVLDSICNALGNFEYFYDVDGHFVFREKKNYLNSSYDATSIYRLDNAGREYKLNNETKYLALADNNLSILDDLTYKVDYSGNSRLSYTFGGKDSLSLSFSNNPNYTNIKNDYHIWGKNEDDLAIHYHLAFKQKPTEMNTYNVVYLRDNDGIPTGGIRLAEPGDANIIPYTPVDWRAELYLRGLAKKSRQERPDMYEQELLDLFDSIYDFKEKKFKVDIVSSPNDLLYFLDYIEPIDMTMNYTVEEIGQRTMTEQHDKVIKLFNVDVPNVVIMDNGASDIEKSSIQRRCELEGYLWSNVDSSIYANLAIGTIGYSAEEKVRDLLYQHTNYAESVSISVPPIYYLEPNTRISITDDKADISGEYIIKSFSVPLDGKSNMTISATRALDRV